MMRVEEVELDDETFLVPYYHEALTEDSVDISTRESRNTAHVIWKILQERHSKVDS